MSVRQTFIGVKFDIKHKNYIYIYYIVSKASN